MRGCALAVAVAMILPMVACVAGRAHDSRLSRGADRVHRGMSAVQVKRILGEPSWEGRCGLRFPYGWAGSCVTELGYASAFAPLLPSYRVVELDQRGRVLSVDQIDSP